MFGGTGTVALIAHKTGRRYLHIDISEEYNEVAKGRIEDYEKEQSQLEFFKSDEGQVNIQAIKNRKDSVIRKKRGNAHSAS